MSTSHRIPAVCAALWLATTMALMGLAPDRAHAVEAQPGDGQTELTEAVAPQAAPSAIDATALEATSPTTDAAAPDDPSNSAQTDLPSGEPAGQDEDSQAAAAGSKAPEETSSGQQAATPSDAGTDPQPSARTDQTKTSPEGMTDQPETSPEWATDQPEADAPPVAETGVLTSALDGRLAIDKSGGATGKTSNAWLYTANGTAAQRVTIAWGDDGLATLTLSDGTALDVSGGKAYSGANVWWYKANGTAAQKWRVVTNEDGSYTLHAALDEGLVLDVSGAQRASGANLQLYAKNGTAAQRFLMTAVVRADSDPTLDGKTFYVTTAVDGSKALDIRGGSTANGAQLQVYSSNGTYAQAFRFERVASGYYVLRPHNSRKALDVDGGKATPGTRVQQWAYDASNPNQWWQVAGNPDGTYSFFAYTSGLALDLSGGSAVNGQKVWLYTSNGTKAQRWNLVLASGQDEEAMATSLQEGVYHLVSAASREGSLTPLVVDVQSGSTRIGANVQLYSDNSTIAQRFQLVVNDDKTVTFRNIQTGHVLDLVGGSAWGGGNVQMYASNGTAAQRWVPYLNDDGSYSFRSVASGLALDAASGSSGANVRVSPIYGSATQRFYLQAVADPRTLSAALRSGEIKSIRLIGDSTTTGYGTSNYYRVDPTREKRLVLTQNGTDYYESNSGSSYAAYLRDYAASLGIDDFVNAAVEAKTMRTLAQYSSSWLGEGADLIFVNLSVNDYPSTKLEDFRAYATEALEAAAAKCRYLVVLSPVSSMQTKASVDYRRTVGAILRDISEQNGYLHVSLTDAPGKDYTWDGLHPNDAGHARMWETIKTQLCL